MNQRERPADSTISAKVLRSVLKSQYHAALAMLRQSFATFSIIRRSSAIVYGWRPAPVPIGQGLVGVQKRARRDGDIAGSQRDGLQVGGCNDENVQGGRRADGLYARRCSREP